jgi:hypothetical protein
MRTFAALAMEMIGMAGPSMAGIATREWPWYTSATMSGTRREILARWDETTGQIDRYWAQIPPGHFQEHEVASGVYPGQIYSHLLYFI